MIKGVRRLAESSGMQAKLGGAPDNLAVSPHCDE